MLEFAEKEHYTVSDLMRIVKILRDPADGCPWDSVQTHTSIRMNFVEETYEVLDAIDLGDAHLLCEELGDVMMQVALHTEMEREKGTFDFDDVCDGVCKKLIYRHPHIFKKDSDPQTSGLNSWDALKNREKGRGTAKADLESVPAGMPALMRAAKVQKRASAYGYAGYALPAALENLDEETTELKEALHIGENIRGELGDMLFAAVQVARAAGVDPEEALGEASRRFADRVILCEKQAQEAGQSLKDLAPDVHRALWKRAKEMQLSEGKK